MKIVIFAGGVGTRLWPLSRKNSPKQFEKIINNKSTLQETVERLTPQFKPDDIFIATGKRYEDIVRNQLFQIPRENFIFEPEMRDVGPAIGLASFILGERYPKEPMAILWSDHLVKNAQMFREVLTMAEDRVLKKESNFVFIAQKARFANQNIGWIELKSLKSSFYNNSINLYRFKRLIYRPKLEDANYFFNNRNYVWNLGYFVTTPLFLKSLFETLAPVMSKKLKLIADAWGRQDYEKILKSHYSTLEKISFDDAILQKMDTDSIYVISADLGWSDVGAWEALKEALSGKEEENVTKGNVLLEESRDSLVFNYAKEKLCVGIDLDKMLVITTQDVVLVCPKTSVPKIKKFVEKLAGTSHEHLT
ncbi:sugar phosphate nucleotidyltransferase [Patescibacteria group bacterium]|nr:sugar phosphate nucleotidyltransferase [Patescibacteria group bacterium]